MALITCPECGAQVSDRAPTCPQCGAPVAALAASTPPAQPAASRPKRRHVWLWWTIAGVALIAVAAIVVVIANTRSSNPANTETDIEVAVASCTPSSGWVATVGDNGNTLTLDMEGQASPGMAYEDVFCILHALDLPDSVESQMLATRALDGRQTATWGTLAASWSYHPDDGLDVVVSTN